MAYSPKDREEFAIQVKELLDLKVKFENETKPLTAFSCPQGHFQWTVVPFGLKQAPVLGKTPIVESIDTRDKSTFTKEHFQAQSSQEQTGIQSQSLGPKTQINIEGHLMSQCSEEQTGIQRPLHEQKGIQCPILEALQPLLETEEKLVGINTSTAGTKFYVIFYGPCKGFYSNWTNVEPLVKGIPYKHKSFKTFAEAQKAFLDNCKTKDVSPNPHKQFFDHSNITLSPFTNLSSLNQDIRARPRMPLFVPPSPNQRIRMVSYKDDIQSSKTENVHYRFKNLGKNPSIKEPLHIPNIRLQDFLLLEEEAQIIGTTALDKNYFGTIEKKFGQFIFFEGADSTLIQTAFHCGLTKMIIPSRNMEEIKLLDDSLYKSLQDFVKYVVKEQSLLIVLKINNTIPFWDKNNILIRGYHHIQIKIVQELSISEPIEGQTTCVDEEVLDDWRSLSYQRILIGLKAFDGQLKIKVNHFSKFILVTSKTRIVITNEGIKMLCNFEKNFYNIPNVPPSYARQLYPALKSSLANYHTCQWCEKTKEKTDELKSIQQQEKDRASNSSVSSK
ncbi:Uncharacterized protein Adt_41693 [Abeliophyllum distichum]|uniref:Ribonuclease H1 N-terminal domain-containing protein n=1 Tax=Abeliophyllum distichum TaxID=126358 RepID=A0ABD1PPK0_9LAMI